MIKKIIIVLLVLVEVWSVTGVIFTLNKKDNNENIQNEINNELNKEEDNTSDETVNDNKEDNEIIDNFDKIDEVIIDNNSTSSDNNKENDKEDNVVNNNNSNTNTNTNTNNNQDNNTENKNEQNKEEKPIVKPEEPVKLISTETKEENSTITKYGVKITALKTYTINTYSNGKVEKIEINSSNETYDKSGFNATTDDLKNEATGIATKNKDKYIEMLGYVNEYRSVVGRNSLILDDKLSIAATIRAMELAYTSDVTNISHTRPKGSKYWTVLSDMNINYSATGENIAADSGYRTPKTVTNLWKNSKGHYENMINDKHGKMGIGYIELGGNQYWVQIFTN